MLVRVRPYKPEDYATLAGWYEGHGMAAPPADFFLEDGTFVLEINGELAASLSVFLTQSPYVNLLEGFIGNPKAKFQRSQQNQHLVNRCYEYARSRGAKSVFCHTDCDKLNDRYEVLGMRKIPQQQFTLMKEL